MKTYKYLISTAISDLESFFKVDVGFKVPHKFETGNFIAKVQRENVVFSEELGNQPLQSIVDVIFCLIIVGHEFAHLLNMHNSHKDKSSSETSAIEAWADFFGARVTFTLLTYGNGVQEIVDSLIAVPFARPPTAGERQNLLLSSFGRGLLKAYQTLYQSSDGSKNYPHSSIRVLNVAAGISSFFFRYFNKLLENWTLYVFKKILINNKLAELAYNPQAEVDLEERVELIQKIHMDIKAEKVFISAGMKEEYVNLIGTHYSDNKEIQRKNMDFFKSEFKKWEFEVKI